MINVYYVFNDRSGEWLTKVKRGIGIWSPNWTDAVEFHDEAAAQRMAEKLGGVAFGWVQ